MIILTSKKRNVSFFILLITHFFSCFTTRHATPTTPVTNVYAGGEAKNTWSFYAFATFSACCMGYLYRRVNKLESELIQIKEDVQANNILVSGRLTSFDQRITEIRLLTRTVLKRQNKLKADTSILSDKLTTANTTLTELQNQMIGLTASLNLNQQETINLRRDLAAAGKQLSSQIDNNHSALTSVLEDSFGTKPPQKPERNTFAPYGSRFSIPKFFGLPQIKQ